MTKLKYDAEVTRPHAFEDQAPDVQVSGEELELTKRVIELSTPKKFDFSADDFMAGVIADRSALQSTEMATCPACHSPSP
jgi:hypothetical protein